MKNEGAINRPECTQLAPALQCRSLSARLFASFSSFSAHLFSSMPTRRPSPLRSLSPSFSCPRLPHAIATCYYRVVSSTM
eukprot:6180752-Pleurochrysis_carterae.AAC.2